MSFPPGAHLKRTNFSRIDAREYDRIIAALRAGDALEAIALSVNRSPGTIDHVRQRAGIERRQVG